MKCALILLSLVALCYSSPVSADKKVSIDEDGSIKVLGGSGRWIIFSKNNQNRGKNIEIAVGGPTGVHKKIHIDEENNSRSVGVQEPLQEEKNRKNSENREEEREKKNQAEILSEIFQQYQGVVDEKSYKDLLEKVNSYVQSGDLSASVYDILRGIDVSSNMNKVEAGLWASGNGIQQNAVSSGLRWNNDGVQYGRFLYGLRREQPYANRYVVPQVDESVLYGRVPVDSEYPGYENVINGQRYVVQNFDGALPASRELLGLYKPQQRSVYQQWMNYFRNQEEFQSEQPADKLYLQLINIQQSSLSPVQRRELDILNQYWMRFQSQLSPVEERELSYLYKKWISCEQLVSAEKYQCDNLHGEWISFQQRLSLGQRQLLSSIHQQWVAIQQELSLRQLSQLEQLWSTVYQRWVKLEQLLTFEQLNEITAILFRLINFNQQNVKEWNQFQKQQYYNLRYQWAKLNQQLSSEQQQELSNFCQISVIISRLQINAGEWIQLKQQLNSYIRQLVSGQQGVEGAQNQSFLRLYQKWIIYVDNLVYFEQGLQNIYEQWVFFQQKLSPVQLQQFRFIFPQWISLKLQKVNGIWSQLQEEQYENVQNQWAVFQQQLSVEQQQLLDNLSRVCHLIVDQNIDGANWYSLVRHLDVYVQKLIASSQQDIRPEEQLEFYEIYRIWVESVSRRINVEQWSTIYGQYDQSQYRKQLDRYGYSGLAQPSRQSNVVYPWEQYMQQRTQQGYYVPQQYQYGVVY